MSFETAYHDSALTHREKIIIAGILLVQGFAVWARGGTYVQWQAPLPWLAGVLALAWLFWPDPVSGYRARLRGLIRDPILYLGAAFLVLLILQADNAGRVRIFDARIWNWVYTDPPNPGWPSAVTRAEAMEMLRWFFPAGIILLSIRHGLNSVASRKKLVVWMTVFAGINALWGIIQFLFSMDHMHGFHKMPGYFFASFGYPNHGGSYYMLSLSCALGLLIAQFRDSTRSADRAAVSLWLGVMMLLLLSANFTLSRAGIMGSWGLLVFAGIVFFSRVWKRMPPDQRFNILLGTAMAIAVSYFLVSGLGNEMLSAEIEKIKTRSPEEDFQARWFQVKAALSMVRDNPLFGVGGWGYRYFMTDYMDPDLWEKIGVGTANVHNDAAQFMAEFGLVGFSLMTGIGIVMLSSNIRYMKHAYGDAEHYFFRPLCLLPAVALGLVVLQSMVDLPFRSPAVMYTWLILFACLAPAADDTSGYSMDGEI